MLTVLDAQDLLLPPPSRTLKFEGRYDVDVAFFVVDIDPGRGPDLHRHPYAEIFVPVSGIALLRTGYESIEATPDQVVIVGADTDHAFTNSDEQRLRMICIHASGEMVTEWLEGAQS